ncbi:HD-GYP domain-containing protein [Atopomonas sediminilitoris]|uniref:HD-GYP domain-containing protein n=1 Tax=Atopomonas sediminilitoris TaxID=2919919 RepID=UPI001F4E69FB|nr:HD-GYP domain-containing protein [Atopomonas sediminilitoris]MCJ8168260.1 HD-GYP domain-containing protein [Atopomonas sediminilitoris]
MLKRISSSQLRLGMFLHELCGSWMEHPFWRSKFLLKDPKDIARIIDSGISEVWIDTSKGLDADEDVSSETREDVDAEVEQELSAAVVAPPVKIERTSLADEVERAAQICAKSKAQVVSMFNDARMGKAIEAEQCQVLVEDIANSVSRNPGALISLARLKNRDEYTYMHSVAVCALMIALARQLDLDEDKVREAGMAGLLHDLGKAMIPLDILNKPGKLTDGEFVTVKSHPEEGFKLLRAGSQVTEAVMDVCLHHHEKVDGSGYPHRLKGDEISLLAKMGAVCDVYDAITSDRPYKKGWGPAESLRKMAEWSKGHFDEAVFQAFVKTIGIYPVGSLVRLESGRLGVVTEQNAAALLKPVVKVFFSAKSKTPIPVALINLADAQCDDKILGREPAENWNFSNLNELWAGVASF